MMDKLKAQFNRWCPPVVVAARWFKHRLLLYLLASGPLLLDTLKPRTFRQWYDFRKLSRQQKRLSAQRIQKFWNDKYDKVLICKINHRNAGFFAYLTFVFNQLVYCEKHNYLPVIY